MKLQLKHLAPYLPYGLKITFDNDEHKHDLVGLELNALKIISPFGDYGFAYYELSKPILRNLSDLTKEIEVNGEKFIPKNRLRDLIMVRGNYSNYDSTWINDNIDIQLLPYWMIEKLLEWHFDIYELIGNNLAIDINKI
jgi:hypothetical protein